jgi:hypothetical protein
MENIENFKEDVRVFKIILFLEIQNKFVIKLDIAQSTNFVVSSGPSLSFNSLKYRSFSLPLIDFDLEINLVCKFNNLSHKQQRLLVVLVTAFLSQ